MLGALDIVLIVLGSIFLAITLLLLLVGAFFYRRRRDRVKQRDNFYANQPVHTVVRVNGEEKTPKPLGDAAPEADVEVAATFPSEELKEDEKRINRPQHIAIPSLLEVNEVKAEKALSYDTNIRIDEFCKRVQEYHDNDDTVFFDEFEMLNKWGLNPMERTKSMVDSEANMKRNRFMDVLPYDDNRVKLSRDDDYINASYIDGYNKERVFIATQGPLGEHEVSVTSGRRLATVRDFWQMVWEHDVRCIIMLTQCVENCRPKCAQYWPSNVGETEEFGELEVDLMSTTDDPICLHREFDVRRDGETKEISQYHFKEWEDAKAPESREHLLDFVERIRKSRIRPPILVHCSAGVGRTGVFIALYNLLTQLDDPSTHRVDVYRTVCKLREQRVRMVQTPEQYVTLYDTVAAAITCRHPMEEVYLRDSDTTASMDSDG